MSKSKHTYIVANEREKERLNFNALSLGQKSFKSLTSTGKLVKYMSSVSGHPIISVFTIPLVILLVGILLSVKYSTYRKSIGAGLVTIGIIEMLPFVFYLGLKEVITPLFIFFIEGCITLVCGIAIFYLKQGQNK